MTCCFFLIGFHYQVHYMNKTCFLKEYMSFNKANWSKHNELFQNLTNNARAVLQHINGRRPLGKEAGWGLTFPASDSPLSSLCLELTRRAGTFTLHSLVLRCPLLEPHKTGQYQFCIDRYSYISGIMLVTNTAWKMSDINMVYLHLHSVISVW